MLQYLLKKVNSILDWIYSKDGYYCLKSGMFIDHYFKKIVNRLHKEFIYYTGLLFMDNFILTRLINKFFTNFTQFNEKLVNFKKKNNFFAMK